MNPIHFPEANIVYTKPEGWTDDQCGSLSVHRMLIPREPTKGQEEGRVDQVMISCWQPSDEEIEEIKEGKPVYLLITAAGQPPVALMTQNPFANVQTT